MVRRASENEAVDVHLVDAEDGVEAVQADADRRDRERARRRVLRWIGVAVVAVLVVAAVVVNLADARRESDRRASLAEVPGILDPLDGPPTVAWSVPSGYPVGAAGGVILLQGFGGVVDAVDAETGELRWTRPVTAAAGLQSCLTGDRGGPEVVLCTAPDGGTVAGGDAMVRSVVLDPATGEELLSRRDPGVVATAEVVDGDAVVALAQSDGVLLVTRWDVSTGEERWSYRSPAGLVPPEGAGFFTGLDEGTLVVVSSPVVVVDLATGQGTAQATDAAAGPMWSRAVALADGAKAAWQAGWNLTFGGGAVLEPDGAERFALPGPVWESAVDDGSVPDVLLVVTGEAAARLEGLDSVTGEQLWTAGSLLARTPIARVDGVALVDDGSAVVAVRITDGQELWRRVADRANDISAVTDGDVVVLPRRDDGGRFLAAHRLQDGTEVWRVALPEGVDLVEMGGRLLVVGAEGVTALG